MKNTNNGPNLFIPVYDHVLEMLRYYVQIEGYSLTIMRNVLEMFRYYVNPIKQRLLCVESVTNDFIEKEGRTGHTNLGVIEELYITYSW